MNLNFIFSKSMNLNSNLNFIFSKSINLNILIKHSTNLDFFDLELTKQKQQFVSGLYQHIVQTFHKIYQTNRKFVM